MFKDKKDGKEIESPGLVSPIKDITYTMHKSYHSRGRQEGGGGHCHIYLENGYVASGFDNAAFGWDHNTARKRALRELDGINAYLQQQAMYDAHCANPDTVEMPQAEATVRLGDLLN